MKAEHITDADDPLAALDALSPDERAELATATVLFSLGHEGELAIQILAETDLLGLGDGAADRILEFAVGLHQLHSADPAARLAAAERFDLSDKTLALAEQEAATLTTAKHRRNAQNLASVYSAAVAAGADFGTARTPREIAQLLRDGIKGSADWGFEDTTFKVPIENPNDLADALEHIGADFGYRSD